MMGWLFVAWLVGVGVCLWTVNKLWIDGGSEMEKPWEKRE